MYVCKMGYVFCIIIRMWRERGGGRERERDE